MATAAKTPSWIFRITVGAICMIVLLWLATPFLVRHLYPALTERGQFGDIFGSVNALFSGLALAGVVIAILLQREELALQREELAATRVELARAAQAQEDSLKSTEDKAKRQLRAYMGTEPSGTHFEGPNGYVKYFEKNYGQTPATDLTMHVCIVSDVPSKYDGPFAKIGYCVSRPERRENCWLQKRDETFFMYGYLDYTDCFRDKWRRRFAFMHYDPAKYVADDEWIAHHEHNDEIRQPAKPGARMGGT